MQTRFSLHTTRYFVCALVLLLGINLPARAQELASDSIRIQASDTLHVSFAPRKPKPQTAAILSAVLPGAGQVYNGKAWKLPIIYGAFATTLYFISDFGKRYDYYRAQYDIQTEDYMKERAKQGMIYYRRYRDVNYIATFAIYVLNILDANVDAHLADLDVSDDISLNISPIAIPTGQDYSFGLACRFKF